MQDDAIIDVIEYMWENYDQRLTLERLAAHVAYSKYYFLRQFKSTTGVTPGRYLTAVRLARSKEMIAADTDMSITDLSLAVGYDSMGAFCTKFRQGVGVTPSEYRAAHRGEERQFFALPEGAPEGDVTVDNETSSQVRGRVSELADAPKNAFTYVGLFPAGNPYGVPSACAVLADGRTGFSFSAPTSGRWSLLALSAVPDHEGGGTPIVAVGRLDSTARTDTGDVTLKLRARAEHALPILTAMPELHMKVMSGSTVTAGRNTLSNPA